MNELLAQVVTILRGMWKYRWIGMMIAWPVLIIGLAIVYLLPNKYEASARVHVDTQSMLRPLLRGMTMLPNVEQEVAMMTRTMLSRPNVERLMRASDIDLKAKTPQQREELISKLQSDIKLGAGRGNNLYTISFSHEDRVAAQRVVQSMLNMFVEESLGDNKKDAANTRRFIDQQIKAYEAKLVAAEARIKDFKLKYMGSLPGSGGDYFARMQAAGARVEQARTDLREAETSLEAVRKQLAGESSTMDPGVAAAEPEPEIPIPTRANPALEARIDGLNKQLDELLLRFTNEHPDVKAGRRLLAQLEAQREEELGRLRRRAEEERKAAMAARAAGKDVAPSSATSGNPVYQQLRLAVAEAEGMVALRRQRLEAADAEFKALRAKATSIPEIESEFTQLNRDYEIHRSNYQRLLASRETVSMSEEMENTARIVDFRIVDPPRVTPTPVWPNRVLFTSIAFGIALGAGVLITLLLSQVRPGFYDTRTLREKANRPLLGTVSMVWNRQQRRRARAGAMIFASSCLAFAGVYGGGLAYFVLTSFRGA